MILLSSTAAAAVLHVGAGHPHATVSAAVAVAADGDVILVHDALVAEEVTVDGLELVIRAATASTWDHEPVAQIAVLHLVNGADVTLRGFDLVGRPWVYGIVVEQSALTVVDGSFDGFYGAIQADGASTVAARSARFTDGWDTAIWMDGGGLDVRSSVFQRNASGTTAGAISAGSGPATVTGSRFVGNEGPFGAVWCYQCALTDNVFQRNVASGSGAAVLATDAELVRNRFCANEALGTSAVLVYGTSSLRNNLFVGNTDLGGASALATDQATVELVHNTFVGNPSFATVAILNDSDVTFTGNVVADNPAAAEAFYELGATSVTSSWNAWDDNAGGDATWVLGPTELVGVDPLLSGAGGTCSWERVRPLAGSPLIDGDPTLLDADGTPADLGATGGPDAP